jgi:hypothetical protein
MTPSPTAIHRASALSLFGILKPAVVRVIHNGATEQSPLTVQASVEGIRRAEPDRKITPAVVVKLTFDNSGTSHVIFDPNSLELENGLLRPFPQPLVQPPGIIDLVPGQRQEVTATFPLPPASDPQATTLTNLRLRWEVRIDNYPVPQTALFEERAGGSSSPGPSPQYSPDVAY